MDVVAQNQKDQNTLILVCLPTTENFKEVIIKSLRYTIFYLENLFSGILYRLQFWVTCGLFKSSVLAGGVGLWLGLLLVGGRFLSGGPNRKERSDGRRLSFSLPLPGFLRLSGLPPSAASWKSWAKSKKSPPGGRGFLFFFLLMYKKIFN